jgi:tetratricopeptide (TPR) repeat protein
MEDGSPPPEGVAIRRSCTGSTSRKEAFTDSRGYYTLMLGQMTPQIPDASDQTNSLGPYKDPFAGTPGVQQPGMTLPSSNNPQMAQASLWNCELTAEAPGFRSDRVSLAGVHAFDQQTRVRTIILHRTEKPGDPLVSLTSLRAPSDAKKNFDKGQEALAHGALTEAAERLEKAVKIYPNYAVAWSTLGEVYERQGRAEDAQAVYEKAIVADSKFAVPYLRMANLSAIQKKWQDVNSITERAMALDSGNVAQAYYLNAVANFNLGRMDIAEKRAQRAQQLDPQHHIARIELLIGYIEARKGNYAVAAEHMRTFVKLEPGAEDLQQVQERIGMFERASNTQPASVPPPASASPRQEPPPRQ